jgi:hypothetical protein
MRIGLLIMTARVALGLATAAAADEVARTARIFWSAPRRAMGFSAHRSRPTEGMPPPANDHRQAFAGAGPIIDLIFSTSSGVAGL